MLSLLVTTDEYTMCNEAAKLRKNMQKCKFSPNYLQNIFKIELFIG